MAYSVSKLAAAWLALITVFYLFKVKSNPGYM